MLQPISPALFLWAGKYPVTTHYPDNGNVGPVALFDGNPATKPAEPGDVVILWGTGFGPTSRTRRLVLSSAVPRRSQIRQQ